MGPVSVAYIQAESFVLSGQPGKCLALAAVLPALPPFPNLVSRLRHKLDVANAHAMLGEYGEAFSILRGIRAGSPGWLMHQAYARDILGANGNRLTTIGSLLPVMLELDSLTTAYPAFRFRRDLAGRHGSCWVAERKDGLGQGVHTVITGDLAELLAALAGPAGTGHAR